MKALKIQHLKQIEFKEKTEEIERKNTRKQPYSMKLKSDSRELSRNKCRKHIAFFQNESKQDTENRYSIMNINVILL